MPDWPIFVISLTDAAARRAAISERLGALGLAHEIVDAIDGRRGLPGEYEAMVDRPGTKAGFGRAMSDGEYACALSHLSVYRLMAERGLPGAIVLEDDAIPGPLFPVFLRDRVFEKAELIQLDHHDARIRRWGGRRERAQGFVLAEWAEKAILATGYSLTARAAAHILAHALPLRAPADWPCDLMPLRPMVALPRIVEHPELTPEQSTLHGDRLEAGRGITRRREPGRFLRPAYWRRWLHKRMTRKVS